MDTQQRPFQGEAFPPTGVRGQILTFKADPFLYPEPDCYDYYKDGLVVIQNGMIKDVGNYMEMLIKYPTLSDIDAYENAVIMPGLIDTHLHYVQAPIVGSYGDTLLTWLNKYTFPSETRFNNKDFADSVAKVFFEQLLEHGTTTANVFATTYKESVDAFFEESQRYNTRMICGKVLQNRNLPQLLQDYSAQESVELSEELLKKWHKRGRQLYAVIPRFAPTSTPEQLRLAGKLYQKYIDQGVYMHTHLDETSDEIAWVKELFPKSSSYTGVYDHFGLLGPLSVFAHCCIVTPQEWELLYKNDCSVSHCPTSNLFIGSGQFKFWEAKDPQRPLRVGVGTDVGAGTNFSIIRTLSEAYKVAMINRHPLDALRNFYMATRGGAESLHLEDKIGSIAPGMEADLSIMNLAPNDYAQWRLDFAKDIIEKLFVLQTLAYDDLNLATYVAGEKVYDRRREQPLMTPDQLESQNLPITMDSVLNSMMF